MQSRLGATAKTMQIVPCKSAYLKVFWFHPLALVDKPPVAHWQDRISMPDRNEKELRKIDAATLWHPFTQMQEYAGEQPVPPIIVGAEGNFLIANDGKKYLDANFGYWCL